MTSRLPAVVVASVIALPLSVRAQDAPAVSNGAVYRNDVGHSGYTSDPLPTPLTLLWRHTTQAVRGSTASPCAAGGLVYFASGPRVYALNAIDGSRSWQFPSGGDAGGNFGATPTVDDGFLYVGNDNSQVYKIDAKTGSQVWVRKVGGAVRSAPVVSGGLVYFGSADRNAYALSADTGEVTWASPSGGSITAAPSILNGQVLFAASDNSLYSFNATTGKQEWSERLPFDPSVSPPIFGNGTLYVGSGDTLYALQGRGGGARWQKKLSGELSTPPTYGNGSVYAATQDRGVYAFSDRGRLRWSKSLEYPCGAPPLLAGDVLMVATQHGTLYGLDAQTGALRWEYVVQPGANGPQAKYASTDIAAATVWADKTLYALSSDGTLSAFRGDAVDKVVPQATNLFPFPGSTISGIRIPYSATLVDLGSGIDPASVSLQVDQAAISLAKYDPSRNGVVMDLSRDLRGDANRPLNDGTHQVTLKAQDWRGNALTKTWAFVVDNRFNPRVTPPIGIAGDPAAGDPGPGDAGPAPASPPPLQPQTGGSTNGSASIPRGPGGRDPDGGVNGGPPPPPPIEGGGGAPPPPSAPGGGGGGGVPPPPTPPAPTPPPTPPGGGAPPPPSPPV